jgi:signal transduction histidine kinase
LISFRSWWKNLAEEEAEEASLFQTERARIIRALLLLGVFMTTFFMVLALLQGLKFPWLPLLTTADLLALAFWIDRKPQDYRWVSRLLFFPSLGLIFLDVLSWPPDILAPPLVFLPTMAYFAVLLDGPRAGILLTGLELALLTLYVFLFPQQGLPESMSLSNLFLVTPGYFIIGWTAWRQFRNLGRSVVSNAGELKNLTEECDQILATIFQSLEEKVSQARRLLRGANPASLPAVRAEVNAMVALLKNFTVKSLGIHREELPSSGTTLLDQARLKMIRVFVAFMLFFFTLGGLRNILFYDARDWFVILAPLSLLALFQVFLSLSRLPPKALPWIFNSVFYLCFIPSLCHWGRESLSPPLFVIPLFVVVASLTGPVRLGLTALGLYSAVVGWFLASPVVWLKPQLYILIYLGLLAPDLLAAGWIFWRLRNRQFERMGLQTESYHRSLRMRRRLLGTLLHDMRNPLSVLSALALENPSQREWATIRDMADRMSDILKSGRDLLDVEGSAPRHLLKPVAWGWMVEEIQALFTFQMREKEITLETVGDPALKALAMPDLLVNSIVANLVSNALKFSPRGSVLRLEAKEESRELVIRFMDRGPGFSKIQLEAFRLGQSLESSPGTEGEPGLGLGLFLSRDYARFMGGNLELRSRTEGGDTNEVILRLKKA